MPDIDTLIVDLDALMDRIFEDPTLATPEDIELIIAKQRQYRAQIEGGAKPKKKAGASVEINLEALGLVAPKEPVKRRF